jgi:hypothetical protein
LLIAKDELVVVGVGVIIEHPVVARMVSVLIYLHTSISDTDIRGTKGAMLEGGRDMLNEVGGDVGTLSIGLNEVDEGGDPGKVNDGIVLFGGDGGCVVWCHVSKGFDGWHEFVSPDLHAVQEDRVALLVMQDSPTE